MPYNKSLYFHFDITIEGRIVLKTARKNTLILHDNQPPKEYILRWKKKNFLLR